MRETVSSRHDPTAAPNRAARRKHRTILRKGAVCERVGLSSVQVWRKANDPDDDFPVAVILGPNSSGFFEDEIDSWLNSRPRGVAPWKPGLREYQGQRAQEPEPEAVG